MRKPKLESGRKTKATCALAERENAVVALREEARRFAPGAPVVSSKMYVLFGS